MGQQLQLIRAVRHVIVHPRHRDYSITSLPYTTRVIRADNDFVLPDIRGIPVTLQLYPLHFSRVTPSLSVLPFLSPSFSFPRFLFSLPSVPLEIGPLQYSCRLPQWVWGIAQWKSNLVHFSLKI